MAIHPTAIISTGAVIPESVSVGPYCVIGENVTFGEDCVLHSHVIVDGHTTIGNGNHFFPFSSIGMIPQDRKFHGEHGQLIIGDNNTFREHVTVNPGTEGGGMVTKIGNNCLLLVGAHVAHDCVLGDHVILVNNATIGGHVVIGDHVLVGGLSAVHQFARIGAHAVIGGMTGVEGDVVPFATIMSDRGYLAGLNYVGLKRRGYTKEQTHNLRRAFKEIFSGKGNMKDRLQTIRAEYSADTQVQMVIDFLEAKSDRPLTLPRQQLND